jgi:CubicO group peptidase (beta-lactamase class C family)
MNYFEAAWEQLTSLSTGERPLFPGMVLAYGVDGEMLFSRAGGYARCYADQEGTLLPEADRIEMRTDTIFDVASISKLFTSLVIMQLVEAGRIDLDQVVVDYLPEFASEGKEAVTVRQLLSHTSGFPALVHLWRRYPDPRSRINGALIEPLVAPPGTTYCYSDLNLITLGELARRITGHRLDALVRERITEPLGMIDSGYAPAPELRSRIAATEHERDPDRGVVWGEVHDENAWSLDGVAGHAGVFSTATDLAVLADVMINRGRHRDGRLLGDEAFTEMITNQTPDFDGHDHGLGFEINQSWYMGRLAAPNTIGHTGYTGTSLVIDLDRRAYAILLTNRVHPSRERGSVNPARVIAGDALADYLDT